MGVRDDIRRALSPSRPPAYYRRREDNYMALLWRVLFFIVAVLAFAAVASLFR